MLTGERYEVKTADYSLLVKIFRKVASKSHKSPHITENYLSTIDISASQVDYLPRDGIDPNFEPAFFEPAPRQKLQALLANSPDDSKGTEITQCLKFPTFGHPRFFDDPLSTTHGLDLYFNNLLARATDETRRERIFEKSCWAVYWPGETKYGPLSNHTGIQNWRVTQLFDVGTPEKPHMMFVMMNEINAKEDCLLQGELMAMIRVMHGRLPLSYFREHLLVPVLIISYTGVQHARLVQGHVQDGKLRVQYTKLYDLRTEQTEIINLFLRYFLSEPVGDTTLKHIKG